MIRDLAYIVPDDVIIALPSKAEGQFSVCLEGGISTRLYLKLLKLSQNWKELSGIESMQSVKDIALTIVREDKRHKDMTADDMEEAINGFNALKALVTSVYGLIPEIVNQRDLKMPHFSAVGGDSSAGTDDEDTEIMSDIAFVMRHTANTFKDIMDMPYITFAALLRSLVLSEALKNPEYREEYEKQKARENLKNGKSRRKGLDYEGLKRFGASL